MLAKEIEIVCNIALRRVWADVIYFHDRFIDHGRAREADWESEPKSKEYQSDDNLSNQSTDWGVF